MHDLTVFCTFLIAFHAITLIFFWRVLRDRYSLIHNTARIRDPIGSEKHYELRSLLEGNLLDTPERHYILKAYQPSGSLWLDDVHPAPPETAPTPNN